MQLISRFCTKADREKLSHDYGLSLDQIDELVYLSDLVRMTGVGPVFAKIIYDSGIKTVNEFHRYDSKTLLDILISVNDEKQLTKVNFGTHDIDYCLDLGKELPILINE